MKSSPRKHRRGVRAGRAYLSLVKQFPLRPLRTPREYDAAVAVLDRLVLREDLSPGEKDYVDAISVFVEDYDRHNAVFDTSSRSPLDLLVHLMEEHDMTVTGLGEVIGSKGIASELLSGKRELSKAHIYALAERFGVEPGLFLKKPAKKKLAA